MEDKEIIGLYFKRDENAIRETDRKYSRYLTVIAYNILGSHEDSAECVNDTYFKAWNAIPPHDPPRLSYFLGKIARELSIDRYRKRKTSRRAGSEYSLSLDELEECVSAGENPEQKAEVSLLAKSISAYLRSCKEEHRNIFVMRYYFCDNVKRIAQCMNMTESNIKTILFRLRAGLKEHLEKEGFSI